METLKRTFIVDRKEINYITITVEAYDGMAVVRTIDPHAAKIEIMISPGCEDLIDKLLESLNKKEGLAISEC